MINAICYSKDRAAQLRLLLDSIQKNASEVFNINILYQATNKNFLEAYNKLINENILPNINWVPEQDFKVQNVSLLDSELPYTCFFTDDDIIYMPINEQEIINCLENDDDIFCFALNLGKNVNVCYTQNTDNVLVPMEDDGNIVKWDWTVHYMDFGYPLSVDGHVFRTDDIQTLSKKVPYSNPNTFEAALQIFENFPKNKMAAFAHSRLVNTPINIVQNVFHNRKGEKYGMSTKELNDKYLNDEIIDYSSLNFSNIVGCHQEIELEFKKLITS